MFPVESVIPALADSLARNRSVVLRAPPGSGKTTCVPPALLGADFLRGKKILMLEPRRIAARSCAAYIAARLGGPVGGMVGYQVRLERKVSSATRLEIVTEGLLAQRLLADPELSDVGLVIFDEFHERSLSCDLGFAMALDVRRALRPDLRLLVMSATLDVAEIAAFMGDADTHTADARMFPVETRYLREEFRGPVASAMASSVRRALSETEGDVLCFLPGEGEIRACLGELREAGIARAGTEVLPLYGALPKEEQDRALAPRAPSAPRRVILATSIAETSLTIPGITVVIDSGLMRVPKFSPSTGMSGLETLRLTADRAEQRRGRAGRVRPGVCYRLWTEATDHSLAARMSPEILDADLCDTVLAAAKWGTVKADGLPWLTPPPAAAWASAVNLLNGLGALDGDGRLTPHGEKMTRFAVHPRLANMMISAARFGAGAAAKACTVAAAVSELGAGGPRRETDLRRIVDLVRECPNDPFSRRVNLLAARWRRGGEGGPGAEIEEGTLLALAYPDRIAKNRGNGTFHMTGGAGACLDRADPLAGSEYLVCAALNASGGDARIHLAAPVSEVALEDLFADRIREVETVEWDRRTDAVRDVRQRLLGAMALREIRNTTAADSAAHDELVRRALAEGVRVKGAAQLGWTPAARQLQARICFLHRVLGADFGWPDLSDAALESRAYELFGGFMDGMSRWTHLEKIDLCQVLDFALSDSGHDRRELDRLAPVKMEVPSGSQMTIHYEESEPFVQVRLQECFGLKDTPKVAGGQIPILMKLLSPAQRPVQITKDLAGFWKNSYQLVRKDLRGRYPKHYWPEDPFTAVATRRVRPSFK